MSSSLPIGTNDGVERQLPPLPTSTTATDDEEDYDNSTLPHQNNFSNPSNNNPYNPYNNMSKTSQNSDDSARSNDNLFRNFKSTDNYLPTQNYNTYPQTTELHPSRDIDSEELNTSPPNTIKQKFFRNKKRKCLSICCLIVI